MTAIVSAFLFRPDAASPGPTRRFTLRLEETPAPLGLALSPDGTRLAYVARIDGARKLLVRELAGTSGRVLEGTEGAAFPFFSPEGEWIGFFALPETQAGFERSGTLKKVSVGGGPPMMLQEKVWFAVWPNEDALVYQSESLRLFRIPAVGGKPEPLAIELSSGGDGPWYLTDVSPDGEALLAVSASGRAVVHRISGGEPQTVVDAGASLIRFVPTGHLAYSRGGTLSALPFDGRSFQTVGTGVPLEQGPRSWDWAFAGDGTLVYVVKPGFRLLWVQRSGDEERLPLEAADYGAVRVSPDGSRLALNYGSSVENQDVWVYEIARDTVARLTLDPSSDMFPLWSRDGRDLLYVSTRVPRTGLFSKASDGSGAEEHLLTNPYDRWPYSWSGDGGQLVLEEDNPDTGSDIVLLSMEDKSTLTPLIRDPFDQTNPQVSPDGPLIAYESNESGRVEVYVRRFPGLGNKVQISTRGGTVPLWGRDNRELFFREGENVLAVPIEAEPHLKSGAPRVLFGGDYFRHPSRAYDYDRVSDRFLMKKLDEATDPREIRVVVHWFEELKRLAPKP